MDLDQERKNMKEYEYDVLVIGAGGAGMRAAIASSDNGVKVAVISKSLLGKAHTVMAEGGAAAALGAADPRDNWKVHFKDTIKGSKYHDDWRMAEIHAKESPERMLELERWGAVFDRTPEGKINQRNFGGHTYPRLAHVGDRTGLEMIRTLQDKLVHTKNVDVFMEFSITKLFKNGNDITGAMGYNRTTGDFVLFKAKAVIIATGGLGKSYKITTNSWELTGDGLALAYDLGAELVDIEFVQFHPTGMVYPLSVSGILVTEGVRGEGGILKNSEGKRFMFNYIPEMYKELIADTEEEANAWLLDNDNNRKPPELLTRDVVAKAILSEVKAGRGSPHGGAFLDIASTRTPEDIEKKLPSMVHQFKTLANLDITKEPMEVGPTTHYAMGGIRVNFETQETNISGLFSSGEAAAGLHGANRLGGNSLSDLVVFGKRSGDFAAKHALERKSATDIPEEEIKEEIKRLLAPFDESNTEDPYKLHEELKVLMGDYIGIIKNEEGLNTGIKRLKEMFAMIHKAKAFGGRKYNPSWHQVLDMRNMIEVGILLGAAALQRKESRGAHTRDDFPDNVEDLREVLYIIKRGNDGLPIFSEDKYPPMPEELKELLN